MFELKLKKKFFIITGGKGYIGKQISKDLLNEGANYVVIDYKSKFSKFKKKKYIIKIIILILIFQIKII